MNTQPNILQIKIKADSRNIQEHKSCHVPKTEARSSENKLFELHRDASSDEMSLDGINPQPIMHDYFLEGQNCKLLDYLRNSISENINNDQNSENLVEIQSIGDDD